MDWKQYLKPDEIQQLADMQKAHKERVKLRRKIFDRCRMRARRAKEKEPCSDSNAAD